MSKNDYYYVQKNVDMFFKRGFSFFLDPLEIKHVLGKIKGEIYNIYYPYFDSDRAIIYGDVYPSVRLYEFISYDVLTHREIMGSIYNMGIEKGIFGDIVIFNNKYYIFVIDGQIDFFSDLKMIGSHHINVKEVSLSILNDYKRKYECMNIIVSSLRIDTVISKIASMGRGDAQKLFLRDCVILNYEICHKFNKLLKEDDVFSIKGYGKYKYKGVLKNTKKGGYVIKIDKYV